MSHVGYDNSAFNIEYFWDEQLDKVWLLEINTRISQSHSDIFEKVDGVSNQQVTVDLALGRKPDMPSGEGQYPLAAKFFHRVFHGDARVARVPTREEIDGGRERIPGTLHRCPRCTRACGSPSCSSRTATATCSRRCTSGASTRRTLLQQLPERLIDAAASSSSRSTSRAQSSTASS
ncbi:MAG: hypothetical protein U5K43_09085 [Halofilum sp. (in: g-proteobacteria)]|nr:hypothetical protein [Halofilum sp. (in: g-proteobacteria)]